MPRKKKDEIPFKKIQAGVKVYEVIGFLDKGKSGKGVKKIDKNFITMRCIDILEEKLKSITNLPYTGHYKYPIEFDHKVIS